MKLVGDSRYTATELCSGTLMDKELLKDVGSKREVIEQICQGLLFLHQKNIIHHDIKPANILISRYNGSREKGRGVKLSDYRHSLNPEENESDQDLSPSSRQWMAPEIFQKSRYTPAADIFSLGTHFSFHC